MISEMLHFVLSSFVHRLELLFFYCCFLPPLTEYIRVCMCNTYVKMYVCIYTYPFQQRHLSGCNSIYFSLDSEALGKP